MRSGFVVSPFTAFLILLLLPTFVFAAARDFPKEDDQISVESWLVLQCTYKMVNDYIEDANTKISCHFQLNPHYSFLNWLGIFNFQFHASVHSHTSFYELYSEPLMFTEHSASRCRLIGHRRNLLQIRTFPADKPPDFELPRDLDFKDILVLPAASESAFSSSPPEVSPTSPIAPVIFDVPPSSVQSPSPPSNSTVTPLEKNSTDIRPIIIGIVLTGAAFFILLALLFCCFYRHRRQKDKEKTGLGFEETIDDPPPLLNLNMRHSKRADGLSCSTASTTQNGVISSSGRNLSSNHNPSLAINPSFSHNSSTHNPSSVLNPSLSCDQSSIHNPSSSYNPSFGNNPSSGHNLSSDTNPLLGIPLPPSKALIGNAASSSAPSSTLNDKLAVLNSLLSCDQSSSHNPSSSRSNPLSSYNPSSGHNLSSDTNPLLGIPLPPSKALNGNAASSSAPSSTLNDKLVAKSPPSLLPSSTPPHLNKDNPPKSTPLPPVKKDDSPIPTPPPPSPPAKKDDPPTSTPPSSVNKDDSSTPKLPPRPSPSKPCPPPLPKGSGPRPPPPSSGLRKKSPLGNPDSDVKGDGSGSKTKLKPFFWDKCVANPDKSMVWHQISSGSFQFNEEAIESLFGYNADKNKKEVKKGSSSDVSNEPVRILDPKKSQNLAILLRALNVTIEEVSDALHEGNELPSELLQTLLKMAPTSDEELKLRLYSDDISKLGVAERFLKKLLAIPLAFQRLDTLLFMGSLEDEVINIKESYATLDVACKELKSNRIFLKLLEAVLKTGNRMNVGTFRGDAQAFKLETLLKLADVKGTDGKTTLLHFVVQEIIRSEGARGARLASGSKTSIEDSEKSGGKDEFWDHGVNVVSSLSEELENVKKAAILDIDGLTSMVVTLAEGLSKAKNFLHNEMKNTDEVVEGNSGFYKTLNCFVENAELSITGLLIDEKRIRDLVKDLTDYFHGSGTGKNEGLHVFVVVRDFLAIVDKVCKEVSQAPKAKVPALSTKTALVNKETSVSQPTVNPKDVLFPAIQGYRANNSDSSSDDD